MSLNAEFRGDKCLHLTSTCSSYLKPSKSSVITMGLERKPLAQGAWGRERTSVVSQVWRGSCSRSPVWLPEHHGRGGQLALTELMSVSLVGWIEGSSEKWDRLGCGNIFKCTTHSFFQASMGQFSCISRQWRRGTLLNMSFSLFLKVVTEGWQLTPLLSWIPAAFFVGHLRHNLERTVSCQCDEAVFAFCCWE